MIPYNRVNPTNPEVQNMENSLVNTFSSIDKNPLLNNLNIVKTIVLTSGVDTYVDHKLGRAVTGWIVINKNGFGDVKQSSTTNLIPKSSIILQSNATITVDILFF
jgi:hypothetical protein